MDKYYLVHDADMPSIDHSFGAHHYIVLGSHGDAGSDWNLLCLQERNITVPASWLAFPPLFDAKTTLAESDVLHDKLADIGLTGDEICLQAVMKLGEIHPAMGF